jgi:polysaccharide export outer membrane protein
VLAQAGLDAAISGGTSVLPPAAPAPATMPAAAPSPVAPAATEPVDLSQAVGGTASKPGMIFVNGKWVEASPGAAETMTPGEAEAAASGVSIPRVIRIPINRLKEGDPRYNIVIRPGDIINVPNIEPGEFYLLGHINRPGVYSLTGRKVTLKQAVAAAGGLDPVAIPRRCDLIRRIGNTEVTVQVDLQRIFDGEQPDIFLKSNDLVNVGTDMIAPFLAVTRNAYRASYGWGFTYDRNFYNQPVISQPAK